MFPICLYLKLALSDGSVYADSICAASIWTSISTNHGISLFHIIPPHSDVKTKGNLSGSIGLGAKRELLKELTQIDEARGKIELKKDQMLLDHAKEKLAEEGINKIEIIHRHGSLVETISELESEISIVIMGRCGENSSSASNHLGSNLERVARSIHKPILVVTEQFKQINSFLIAYDDSVTSQKALEYVVNNSLLKGLKCYLVKVDEESETTKLMLQQTEEKLKLVGFNVSSKLIQGDSISNSVNNYIKDNDIDLLIIGAYGHSKISSMILGSTTTSLIKESNVAVLLLR